MGIGEKRRAKWEWPKREYMERKLTARVGLLGETTRNWLLDRVWKTFKMATQEGKTCCYFDITIDNKPLGRIIMRVS